MVKTLIKIAFALIILLSNSSFGVCQSVDKNCSKEKSMILVGKFSLFLEAQLMSPAVLTNCVGYKSFDNKHIWNGSIGIGYELQNGIHNELFAVFFTYFEPIFRFSFEINENEIPQEYFGLLPTTVNDYTMTSYSVGIYDRYTFLSNKRISYNFIGGINLKYFPHGGGEMGVGVSKKDHTEIMNIFKLSFESPNRNFHGSFQIGTGVGFPIYKMFINMDLLWNYNFDSAITGTYMWWNLVNEENSTGNYNLKGNYTCIKLTIRKNTHY